MNNIDVVVYISSIKKLNSKLIKLCKLCCNYQLQAVYTVLYKYIYRS